MRIIAATVAVVVGLPLAGAAAQQTEPHGAAGRQGVVVSAGDDPAGDVRYLRDDDESVALRARRSIDIRSTEIKDLGRRVRVRVKIRRLLPSTARVEQKFVMNFINGDGDYWGQIGFSSRTRDRHYAIAYRDGVEQCHIKRVRRSPKTNTVTIMVPRKCAAIYEGAYPIVRSVLHAVDREGMAFATDRSRLPYIT